MKNLTLIHTSLLKPHPILSLPSRDTRHECYQLCYQPRYHIAFAAGKCCSSIDLIVYQIWLENLFSICLVQLGPVVCVKNWECHGLRRQHASIGRVRRLKISGSWKARIPSLILTSHAVSTAVRSSEIILTHIIASIVFGKMSVIYSVPAQW